MSLSTQESINQEFLAMQEKQENEYVEACKAGDMEKIRSMYRERSGVDQGFLTAIRENQKEAISFFMEKVEFTKKQANVNQIYFFEFAIAGNADMVKLFLENGVDPTSQMVYFAIDHGNVDTLKVLMENYPHFDLIRATEMACVHGKVDMVEYLFGLLEQKFYSILSSCMGTRGGNMEDLIKLYSDLTERIHKCSETVIHLKKMNENK